MIYRARFGTPSWQIQSPFEELELMRRQMDQLFRSVPEKRLERDAAGVFPAINLSEDSNNFFIRAELPGVSAEDINIQAVKNSLTISGERKFEEEDSEAKYHRREREAGKFSRALTIPGDIDADKVQAKLRNGLLTLTVPKAEKAKPKQISVN
jgi:HSP20 family protein